MLQYTFSLISEKTCHINSYEYLCRATASISVDFQNVLQYSIRRKKRETAWGTLMIICVVLPRVWASIFEMCCITAYAEKKKVLLALSFFLGAPIRIRTRTNGSEDHCAIHYTIRAFTFCLIYLYFSRFCKFVNFISAKNFQFAFILFDKFIFDS